MDEASNTAASNSGEKQKFFAGSVTFCGQRYTCQCRGSSSKSASAVGVDAGHSRYGCGSAACRYTSAQQVAPFFVKNSGKFATSQWADRVVGPYNDPRSPPVGADASCPPAGCTDFTGIFGEFTAAQRGDVRIAPYIQRGNCLRIRRKFSKEFTAFCWASRAPPLPTAVAFQRFLRKTNRLWS